MIYFLRAGEYVKIGYSADPAQRVADFQTANPIDLEIIAVHHGSRREEAMLHRKFAAHRVRGEWFAADPVILEHATDSLDRADAVDFRSWVISLPSDDDPTGDFVSDLRDDDRFPRGIRCASRLSTHLILRGACHQAISAAEDLWRKYVAGHRNRIVCPVEIQSWAHRGASIEELLKTIENRP